MELVLGTATFGSNYGVANNGKIQNEQEALEILSEAQNLGIANLDTSPAYSQAEDIIGKFQSVNSKFHCYSKISLESYSSTNKVLNSLNNSLNRMQIDSLKGLYFHNPSELLATDPIQVETLLDVVLETKKVEKIGASVYELSEILTIQERHPRITLFQVPENIADRRLQDSSYMKTLHNSGVEFHVRSVFLQGLLLMKKAPIHLATAQPFLDKLNAMANSRKCSPLELCISYVKQIEWASKFVVGLSNSTQLREIFIAQEIPDVDTRFNEALPKEICDPRMWKYD